MNIKEGKKKLFENLAVIVVAQAILKAYGYLKNGVFGWEQIKDAVFFHCCVYDRICVDISF